MVWKRIVLCLGASAVVFCVAIALLARRSFETDAMIRAVHARVSDIRVASQNAETCHERLHEFGHEAFAKYGVAALDASDEACNAGYIHGVIEAALADSTDPLASASSLCGDADPETFSGWECFHGLGHGFMDYTDNDLPRSLELCRQLPVGGDACANGVFMENFVAETEAHPTEWRRDDDSFYPCEDQAEGDRTDCYLYLPIWYLERHGHSYASALRWCAEAGEGISACVRGVGSQAMKDRNDEMDDIAFVCSDAPEGHVDDCIAGMADILVMHTGSIRTAAEWCDGLDVPSADACRSEVEQLSRALF